MIITITDLLPPSLLPGSNKYADQIWQSYIKLLEHEHTELPIPLP